MKDVWKKIHVHMVCGQKFIIIYNTVLIKNIAIDETRKEDKYVPPQKSLSSHFRIYLPQEASIRILKHFHLQTQGNKPT